MSQRRSEEGIQRGSTANSLHLVAAVATVVVVVAFPLGADTAAVHAGELARLASGPVIRDAVFIVSKVPASL